MWFINAHATSARGSVALENQIQIYQVHTKDQVFITAVHSNNIHDLLSPLCIYTLKIKELRQGLGVHGYRKPKDIWSVKGRLKGHFLNWYMRLSNIFVNTVFTLKVKGLCQELRAHSQESSDLKSKGTLLIVNEATCTYTRFSNICQHYVYSQNMRSSTTSGTAVHSYRESKVQWSVKETFRKDTWSKFQKDEERYWQGNWQMSIKHHHSGRVTVQMLSSLNK